MQPKYIQNLLRKAEQRQKEQEIVYERKLAKERSKEDHLYAEKDKFVTSAYKRKLAEQAKWMEEERLRQLREERDDVCINFSGIYIIVSPYCCFNFNLCIKEKKLAHLMDDKGRYHLWWINWIKLVIL